MALERPNAMVSFRYKFSNKLSGDMKWSIRIFINGLHVGCLWCTEIREDKQHIEVGFIGPDGRLVAGFYFLNYELIEDE